MPDVNQLSSDLRGMPDQALQTELQQPTGLVPGYLVLAEAQRRQLMRQASQQQQAQGDSSTVLQDVVRNMMSGQPPPGVAPAGMTPPKQGQGSPMPGAGAPGQTPTPTPPRPQGMAQGGALRFDDGGDVEDDQPMPDGAQASPVGSAARIGTRGLPDLNIQPTPEKGASAEDIDGWIKKYSAKYGVDPDMARAIMEHESSGNPKALGPLTKHGGKAIGLFQLMPETAHELGVDPMSPESNVEGGIKYYGQLRQRYKGEDTLALAAYNAGPGAVDKYGGVPPFQQTQDYVPAIMGRYAKMKEAQIKAQPDQPTTQTADSQQPTDNAQPAGNTEPPSAERMQQASNVLAQPSGEQTGEGSADSGQSDFGMSVYAPPPTGRIHQNILDLENIKAGIQKRINDLPDPYSPQNMETQRQNILSFYGLPQNYLQSLDSIADQRKATIRQLQDEALQRYHNPSPWEFLGDIAAGMGQSKSLNLAGAFGQGVGLAWQRRDEQQQQSLNTWNALQQDVDNIDKNSDTARGRFDTVLDNILTHQGTVNEGQRKMLEDQLMKLTTEQDKFKKMLVPTNKLEPLYNPGDYDKADWDRAVQEAARIHGWNKDRMDKELAAIQALAQRGDRFVQGGQFASAYDQFVAKYPNEAKTVLTAKPSKYTPEDIASYADTVNKAPGSLYDSKVVPKEAATEVRRYMADHNMRIPVQPPNKTLHDMAAASDLTLQHVGRIRQIVADPWIVNNVLGPFMGRVAKGEEKIGMEQYNPSKDADDWLPILKTATPQQTRDTQDLLTSLNYLFMREGRSLFGGRPPQMLMQELLKTSPTVTMGVNRFLGAMDGVEASANMAVNMDRAYMYGENPISAIPPKAGVAKDKNGRQLVQAAPGQPWRYVDSGEEYKPPK